MTDLANNLSLTQTAALLSRYRFELRGYTALELIEQWLQRYPAKWVRLAVIEALYQGRYKAVSVEHILKMWLRRGEPMFHFTYEFERLIFRVLPPTNESQSVSDVAVFSQEKKNQFIAQIQEISKQLIHRQPTKATAPVLTTKTVDESGSEPSFSFVEKESGQWEKNERKIHEFTPASDESDFYSKLKAVVQQDLNGNSG